MLSDGRLSSSRARCLGYFGLKLGFIMVLELGHFAIAIARFFHQCWSSFILAQVVFLVMRRPVGCDGFFSTVLSSL